MAAFSALQKEKDFEQKTKVCHRLRRGLIERHRSKLAASRNQPLQEAQTTSRKLKESDREVSKDLLGVQSTKASERNQVSKSIQLTVSSLIDD